MSARTIWSIVAAAGLLAGLATAGPATDAKDAKKDAPAKKAPRPPRPPVVPGPCFLDPNEAGPDYAVQGEYVGTAGSDKVGVQVVAMGKG